MKKRNNILVLTYWSYKDALIQSYTLPYVRQIRNIVSDESRIFVVTFDQPSQALSEDERRSVQESGKKEGIDVITLSYVKLNLIAPFKVLAYLLKLWYLIVSNRIDTIHAWCMPAGSLAYILSILTGRRLIIDSYEPQAEAMVENGTWEKSGLKFKIQFYFEKKLSHHAKVIISATEGMREYAIRKYHAHFKNFYVKPACVDLETFDLSMKKDSSLVAENGFNDKIVCVYAGKFGGIYLTFEVFELFAEAEKFWGDKFRVLLLTNHNENELKEWANQSGFDYGKIVRKFVSHSDIPKYIGLADFAITPVKPIPTKKYCTPIKDGEYWAMGLPIIITKNISDDSDIISENKIGYVLQDLTTAEYKKCIQEISTLLTAKDNTEERIRAIANQYRNFSIANKIYTEIYR